MEDVKPITFTELLETWLKNRAHEKASKKPYPVSTVEDVVEPVESVQTQQIDFKPMLGVCKNENRN